MSDTLGIKNLVRATQRITSHLELDRVLAQVVESLSEELGASYAALWLVEKVSSCGECDHREDCLDRSRCLRLRAWHGPPGSSALSGTIPLGVMKVGTIALSRAPYLTDNLSSDPMVADAGWVRSQSLSSFAGFPLDHGDELLGVMAYFSDRPIDPELGDMLACIAHQSAVAVSDAMHYARVQRSEERYRSLIDGAIDAVLVLGTDGRILNASRSATRHFGYNMEELGRMSLKDFDPDSFSKLRAAFPELLAGDTITYTGSFSTKSGDKMPVEVKAGATILNGNTVVQAFVRDLTERAKLEKQKADLVSMITHDLKGPLSIIMGYSEVIRDQYADGLPEFVQEGLDSIRRSGERLLGMVEDYLSLFKMEAGVLSMHKYPTELNPLLARAMDMVQFQAKEKGLELAVDCPANLPPVEVDPRHLERAVGNLLMNAVNYTPRGGEVKLACALEDPGGDVVISVSDTGVGIPSDELNRIFDMYYRSRTKTGKGTGLGLAIVKSIAECHGGGVSVESAEGKGSTFTIKLPKK